MITKPTIYIPSKEERNKINAFCLKINDILEPLPVEQKLAVLKILMEAIKFAHNIKEIGMKDYEL